MSAAKRMPLATPVSLTRAPKGYAAWIADVKQRVRAAQMRASLAVNHELIALYWSIGRDLLHARDARPGRGTRQRGRPGGCLRQPARASIGRSEGFLGIWLKGSRA